MTEVSVAYSEHQCPSHDLAGWHDEIEIDLGYVFGSPV